MIAAVILAAGSGSRFGGDLPKQFVSVGGKPILMHSVKTFAQHPEVDSLVIVTHSDWIPKCMEWMKGISKPWIVVEGGATRMESVWKGLQALSRDIEYVLIHDSARPFVRPETITNLIDAVRIHRAVIPTLPSADTLVETESNRVIGVPERARIRRVQTPQAFQYSLILQAYEKAWRDGYVGATDDSCLVHRLNTTVVWIVGAEEAFKITTPGDLLHAERLVARLGV